MDGFEFSGELFDRDDCQRAIRCMSQAMSVLHRLLKNGRLIPDVPFAYGDIVEGEVRASNPVGLIASALSQVLHIEMSGRQDDPAHTAELRALKGAVSGYLHFELERLWEGR